MFIHQLWAMIRKEIRIASQQPAQWALVMLTPLVFVAVMGSVFGRGESPTVAVYFVREDEGRLARQVEDAVLDLATLDAEVLPSRAEADGRIGRGERMAAIVIPAGFSAAALTDAGAQVEIIVDPAREQMAGIVLGQVQAATAASLVDAEVTRGVRRTFNTAPEDFGIDTAALAADGLDLAAVEKFLTAAIKGVVASQVQDAMDDPLVRVESRPADENAPAVSPTVFDYLVPGYAVFFGFFLMGLMAETVYFERVSGTLRRLLGQPVRRTTVLLGKAIPYALIAMAQIGVVLGTSALLFDYSLGQAPLALFLLTAATGLVIGGLGLMVAVLVRSEGQANAVPTLLTLVLAAVSGAMFPSISLPTLKLFTPQYWAIDGFFRITALGGDLASVATNLGVLLAMAGACFAVAVWRFRFE
jgi:ABC-2 type transport system permease protein